jgi:hypothetical protein
MKQLLLTIALSVITIGIHIYSQEYVTGLTCNPSIQSLLKSNSGFQFSKTDSKSSLELPIWDDFSNTDIYPDPKLWLNNDIYINSTLADFPPSLGIATFDAADSYGNIYSHAGYEQSFIADSLTSRPINLNYPGNETIYLSFFFQPQGIVDAPDPKDSLIVEFYAPEEKKWYRAWDTTGYQNNGIFDLIILPVNEEKFLKDSFQFQFINYASLGSSTYPSLAVNCDYWHIDYIYLNKNRSINDTVFRDIAFNKPLNSLLETYESVPWSHYKSSSELNLTDVIEVKYRNNANTIGVIDSLNFSLKDLSGNSPIQKGYGGNNIINPFYQYTFLYNQQPFNFPDNNDEFCDFELKVRLVTSTTDSTQNNTVSYIQKFRDYYAYDDGSAEAGYGIVGLGSRFGSVASFFEPLKEDYLRGVYMYFTHAYDEASQKYFWLNVWSKGDDNLPDTLILSLEGKLPEYSDELNKYVYYEFDEPVYISDPYFIGWTQTTEDKLNIGFDLNKTANDKLYYNINGEWTQSAIEGAVMIRPAMGDHYAEIETVSDESVKIFPNPASDFIFFNAKETFTEPFNIQIIDMQGKQVLFCIQPKTNSINISTLKTGIYLIQFYDSKGKTSISRFIKN